jgi:hypothetical protein
MLIKKPIIKLAASETRLGVAPKRKPAKRKKSKACSKVLRLMDTWEDGARQYGKALNQVLKADKRLSKKKLEKELDFYI